MTVLVDLRFFSAEQGGHKKISFRVRIPFPGNNRAQNVRAGTIVGGGIWNPAGGRGNEICILFPV